MPFTLVLSSIFTITSVLEPGNKHQDKDRARADSGGCFQTVKATDDG